MWTDDILTKVSSRIKYDENIQKLKKSYPDFLVTTSMVSSKNPTFPTLVLEQIESPEVGQDLENIEINAVSAGFQVHIIDNQKTKVRINKIKGEVKKILKSMRFNITQEVDNDTADEKRSIIRATRYIAENDIL